MKKEELLNYIKEKYDVNPEYLFSKFPSYFVFRNKKNKKWFAVVMNVANDILNIEEKGYTNILNIKCESFVVEMLLEKKGYFPAYHMDKKNWISVELSENIDKNEILKLIDNSYNLIKGKRDETKY